MSLIIDCHDWVYIALEEMMIWIQWLHCQVENNFRFCYRIKIFNVDILKKYNPDIKGFSTGTGSSNTRFNVAVSGAVAQLGYNTIFFLFISDLLSNRNMPAQAQHLVDKMKADPVCGIT